MRAASYWFHTPVRLGTVVIRALRGGLTTEYSDVDMLRRRRVRCLRFAFSLAPAATKSPASSDGALKMRIQAPAIENRANEAVCEYLGALLKTPKSAVRILGGERSRMKRVEIRGVQQQQIPGLAVARSVRTALHESPEPRASSAWPSTFKKCKRYARRETRRLALLRFSRSRSDRASHLALPPGMRTRRWFYFVPAKGTPRKLVHKIETESLAAVPGETLYYAGYDELRKNLAKTIGRAKVVAMQYSPKAAMPYVAMVDGGTIELVRGAGAKVVSSADLVQKFEACWTPQQLESHLAAGK